MRLGIGGLALGELTQPAILTPRASLVSVLNSRLDEGVQSLQKSGAIGCLRARDRATPGCCVTTLT